MEIQKIITLLIIGEGCTWFQPVTRQRCLSQVSVFMQESKRSAKDLCGRTDGNVKVIFPKEDVAVQPAESKPAPMNAGDYVLVKVKFGLYRWWHYSESMHLKNFFKLEPNRHG